VCLCGSTRFGEAFREANLRETLAGRIVLTIGCDMRSDAEIFADATAEELAQVKARLDELHKRKIDMADEILVVSDSSGYYGESTKSEIEYAEQHGKRIRYLSAEAPAGPKLPDVATPPTRIAELEAQRTAMLALVEQAERGARRWAQPLQVPPWTSMARKALGAVCCDLHQDNCCDPTDCGPCCPDCPTCPELVRRRIVGLPVPARAFTEEG
jgi:hypothetical protein